jgi:formate-dependent phosphoribosylglycinamide formyltransferase (GAR transformylase)
MKSKLERPRVLLVAATTGYQSRAFVDAATSVGVSVSLATDRCHILDDPWGDHAYALRFEDPEGSAETLAATGEHWDGIIAVGDRPAYVASVAAARLGLPFHPPEAVAASGNKLMARELFRRAGLPVPAYFAVPLETKPLEAAARAHFPCVVKPLGLSGSRGVIRANNSAEFVSAFERIRALLHLPDIRRTARPQDSLIQIEQFIPGREFALEGIMTAGALRVLALFDKPDPLDGPFFEETIYATPSREPGPVQQSIIEAAASAARALGLRHGPVHAEMRVNEAGAWMLEIAARPIGGLCARVLPGLEALIVRHAAGMPPGDIALEGRSAGVMMVPIPQGGIYAGVSGVEEAAAVAGIDDVIITAKEGQALIPLPEGSSYLGFLFACAPAPADVETALRSAHAKLRFEIRTALPVL